MPDFVKSLEHILSTYHSGEAGRDTEMATQQHNSQFGRIPLTPESSLPERDSNTIFDLDFEDIDWSYWDSMGNTVAYDSG